MQEKTNTITVVLGNAYALQYFSGVENVICTYEDNLITQQLVPQVIFGAIKAEGKLPITAGDSFKQGMGIETLTTSRLSYGLPKEAGISSDSLREIVRKAIDNKAIPIVEVKY